MYVLDLIMESVTWILQTAARLRGMLHKPLDTHKTTQKKNTLKQHYLQGVRVERARSQKAVGPHPMATMLSFPVGVFFLLKGLSLFSFLFLLHTPTEWRLISPAAAFSYMPGARCLGKRRLPQSRTARLVSIVACPRAKADFPSLLHLPHLPPHQPQH